MLNAFSALVGVLLVGLALACFVATPPAAPTIAADHATSVASMPLLSVGMTAAIVTALRSVIVTYDGWYNAIYLAEETLNASRTVPRAMISCALLVTALYVLINLGFLHALSLPALSASKLPAADAAQAILPRGGSLFVTIVSLCTVLSLINATLLSAPRILYAIGRDGLFSGRATRVSAGGTPSVALGITSAAVALLILSGTLDQLIAVAAVLFVINYVSAYSAVIVLRIRDRTAARPFRTPGYPWTTGLVLAGSVLFLIGAIVDDPRSGAFAGTLLAIAAPVGWWISRQRRPVAASA